MKHLDATRLQNAEHLALMSDLLVLLKEANIELLAPLTEKFTTQVELEELAQKQIVKSAYTAKLTQLDQKRDDIFRGLTLCVQSELFSVDKDEKEAAEKVEIVLQTYGNFSKENIRKETSEIDNLLQDLKSETYSAFANKIGLDKWMNWLSDANNELNEIYTLRRDEYAERPDLNLKNIRKDSDVLFKEFRKMVDALEILQPSENLTKLIAKADATIDKWQDTLSRRKSSNKKDDDDVIDAQ